MEARLSQEFGLPAVQVLKRLHLGDIVHQHAAMRAAIECCSERLEALLPRCVPDLQRAMTLQISPLLCCSKTEACRACEHLPVVTRTEGASAVHTPDARHSPHWRSGKITTAQIGRHSVRTCNVTTLSSKTISLVRKSAPMVAL